MKRVFYGGASAPASRYLRTATIFNLARGDARPTKFVLAFVASILFLAVGATAQTTNGLSGAEIQGRQLTEKILEQQPAENWTNNGILEIRGTHGFQTNFPIICAVNVTPTNWQTIYEIVSTNKYLNGFRLPWLNIERLAIIHIENQPTEYLLHRQYNWTLSTNEEQNFESGKLKTSATNWIVSGSFGDFHAIREDEKWSGTEFVHPFAQSDFWAVDLGLEFFHWPEQKVLRQEIRRSRGCTVLESTNPNPGTNGYSRVVSWIDSETFGIVHAEAYDAKGKLLKTFDPKSFKKVNGQWELQEMEIRNVQTGSRTRLKFNLKS